MKTDPDYRPEVYRRAPETLRRKGQATVAIAAAAAGAYLGARAVSDEDLHQGVGAAISLGLAALFGAAAIRETPTVVEGPAILLVALPDDSDPDDAQIAQR